MRFLGLINYVLFQWLFVRLAFHYDDNEEYDGWLFIGPVVPLTGWSPWGLSRNYIGRPKRIF